MGEIRMNSCQGEANQSHLLEVYTPIQQFHLAQWEEA